MLKVFFVFMTLSQIFVGAPCGAANVLVLQSLDVKPYRSVLSGFRSVCGGDIKPIDISGMKNDAVAAEARGADLVLAIGHEAMIKVRDIRDVPVVFVMILNPWNVVPERRNITGVGMNLSPEVQLSILRKALPGVNRLGVLYDPARMGHFVSEARIAASEKGVTIVARAIHNARDFALLLKDMGGQIQAFWLLPDATVVTPETLEFLCLFLIDNGIPIVAFSDKYLETGALISLEIDPFDMGRQAGELAAKILSGTHAGALPWADARKAIVSINLRVAEKLGISISREVLAGAKVFNGRKK